MKINYDVIYKILDNVAFFGDVHNIRILYAEYQMPSGEWRFSNVDGEDFRAFLRVSYAENTGEDEQLNEQQVIQRLHDRARIYGVEQKVEIHHRVAGNLYDGVEYYLADDEQRVVRIDKQGFRLANESKFKFISRAGTLPQVLPVKGETDIFTLLKPFVNITGAAFKLFVVWLIQAFSGGAHNAVFLSAERGSGKSVLTHAINRLLDPSPGEACSMPRNLDDLETLLHNQYLVCLDNIDTSFSKEYSDTFCISVTGGAVARRKKFYDTDMVYLQIKNILLFNGIGIAPSEEDLQERSLFFSMKKLDPTEIMPERELWADFEAKRPQILWCVFDTLSRAAKIIRSITPAKKARLADAYIEMLAVADVLGISQDEFDSLLADSTRAMHEINLEEPVAKAVKEYMDQADSRKLYGPSSEVYEKIKENYSGSKGPLPITAAAFGKKLNTLDIPLKKLGYRTLIDDTGARFNTITIIKSK